MSNLFVSINGREDCLYVNGTNQVEIMNNLLNQLSSYCNIPRIDMEVSDEKTNYTLKGDVGCVPARTTKDKPWHLRVRRRARDGDLQMVIKYAHTVRGLCDKLIVEHGDETGFEINFELETEQRGNDTYFRVTEQSPFHTCEIPLHVLLGHKIRTALDNDCAVKIPLAWIDEFTQGRYSVEDKITLL